MTQTVARDSARSTAEVVPVERLRVRYGDTLAGYAVVLCALARRFFRWDRR